MNILQNDITYLPGVGPQRAKLLGDELGIHTYADLLEYFPFKHIDRSRLYRICELTPDMPFVQIRGQIRSFEEAGTGTGKRRLIAHFTDGEAFIQLVWFNSLPYVLKHYKLHTDYIVFGRPQVFGSGYSISHPDIDTPQSLTLSAMKMQPYYSLTEKLRRRGYTSRTIETFTSNLFRQLRDPLPETLPDHLVRRLHLMSRDEALRNIHYPPTADVYTQAAYRLKFEELFYVQLNIVRFTEQRREHNAGQVFARVGQSFMTFYNEYLPFPLTGAQQRVVKEMRADMVTGRQMNRLLQGDVGSGKTLVALLLMLLAIDNGCQTCIMAPTEILAEQHLATFRTMLADMPLRVELLTGNVKGKRRQAVLEGLAAGEVNILIGTHAVIEDQVVFHNLGLVVIDEQHRFGVAQRARLWQKSAIPPHILVMTATPIPRTLAMTLYGDLDVSVIDELPPGRKPILTLHHYDNRREQLYRGMRQQISLGRQVYVVYPLVRESDKLAARDVQNGYDQLRAVFPDLHISMVHGQMKAKDKDAEMARFVSGETQILVATTVIEVGVNVPNASVMVIENAERFGLAQLHQLRGRVGRGADQSYCILVTGFQLSAETKKRIDVMCATTDGFEIAEADLQFRGPGDIEGTQQSGTSFRLRLANLARDGQIVQLTRDEARRIVAADPQGKAPENAILWARLEELRRGDIDWSRIS